MKMKIIVSIVIISLLVVSSFIFFKINKIDLAQGDFLSEAGESFNELFKRGTLFVGETIEKKTPEVKEEFKKETQELKSEALDASKNILSNFQPLDYLNNVVSKFLNKNPDNSDTGADNDTETDNSADSDNNNIQNNINGESPEEKCEWVCH